MHKTPRDIIAKKAAGKKISVVTAYDYSLALLCDRAGVDVLLVGDSVGMVVLGYDNTIPVMGHIGLQPQTTMLSQGYRVQGKTKASAKKLIESAKALEEAGVFSITLEMVTSEVAKIISESVSVPTIGIGSGKNCDGQVLVIHDMLGMYDKLKPKFVKRYLSLSKEITKAVELYKKDVESGRFPGKENWFSMEKSELDALREEIG